jgi:hypothetical protein
VIDEGVTRAAGKQEQLLVLWERTVRLHARDGLIRRSEDSRVVASLATLRST